MHPTETTPAPAFLPVPVEPSLPPPVPLPAGEQLLGAWLSGRAESTVAAYLADLRHFSDFAGTPGPGAAAGLLLARGHGWANALALAYRGDMLRRGLSPATVNRRLASLRSLVKLARTLGLAAFGLDVPSVRAETYRDTRGPEAAAVRRLLEAAGRRSDRKGLRDRAVLRLLLDLGLRRLATARCRRRR